MPVVRLNAAEWLPDGGPINNGGLYGVYGAVPHAGKWVPSPQTLVSVKAYPAGYGPEEIGGLYIHDDAATVASSYIFLGTDDELYRTASNDGALADASGVATYSAFSPESGWQFTSFGNNVLATNGVDDIQIATTPGTDFVKNNQIAAPTSYDPRAKYLATIKNHVLLGNVSFAAAPSASIATSALTGTSYPELVMWSATNNARRFGDPKATPDVALTGSDWQPLSDEHGPITGISGGESAVIFKRSALYRMDGPPWTFNKIAVGCGTIYPNSIVRFYDDVYFWGPGGPTVLKSGSSIPEIISHGKCQRSLVDSLLGTYSFEPAAVINLCGGADFKNDTVYWSSDNGFVTYNIPSQRFGFFRLVRNGGVIAPTFTRTLMNPTATSINIGGTVASTPGYVLSGVYGVLPESATETDLFRLVASTANVVVDGTDSWDNPTFTWPYITFPVGGAQEEEAFKSSQIRRVRAIYSQKANDPLNITVTVNTNSRFPFANHQKTGSYSTTASAQDDNGWIDVDGADGTHHQISVVFSESSGVHAARALSKVESFFELEVEYVFTGKYGAGYFP